MNSQRSCLEEAAGSKPRSPRAAERNSRADPCRAVCPSCPPHPSGVPLGVTSPSLPADSGTEPVKIPSSAEEPFTIEAPGMCALRFPLQKSIVAVELCPADPCPPPREEPRATQTPGTGLENLEKLCQELPVEPCTLEVLELGAEEPGRAQGAIPADPSASRGGISTDPCVPQGLGGAKDGCQTCPGTPLRLDSGTSSIVERCLSRCQSWFRGKK